VRNLRVVLWALGIVGSAVFGTANAQPVECCEPWDNGRFDERNAQTSQNGFGEDYRRFGRITADDFWLCEGNIYYIRTIRGTMLTNSVVPKADVVILSDCDGHPSNEDPLAYAYSVPPTPMGVAPCTDGVVTISETGRTTVDGLRVIEVEATFTGLWLRGGAYWVSFIGFSGTGDADEEFFWGTSGNQVVKGRPGQFFDTNENEPQWVSIDEICCGCTDFNFCIEGDDCKILVDNIGAGGAYSTSNYGSSINNNNIAQDTRSADDIVVKDCADQRLCYFEGYLFSNCNPPRARLDVYDNACKLPATFSRPTTFEPTCIEDTGETITIDGRRLHIYLVRFWDLRAIDGSPFILQRNKNYWFSIYGLGTGAQNQRAYFAGSDRCDFQCSYRFNQGAISGRGVGLTAALWKPIDDIAGRSFDFAFMVATEPVAEDGDLPPAGTGPAACASDINHDGYVTLQDLFDYLQHFFTGCP